MSNFLYWQLMIFITFSNFLDIYKSKIKKETPAYLRVWRGACFKVFNLNSNLATIIEIWTKEVYKFPAELLNKNSPTIIDIGSNIGAFAIFACTKLQNPSVYAYEPEKNNFYLLTENVKLNKLENRIKSFKHAIYGVKETKNLFLAGFSSGKNSIETKQSYGQSEEVQCITLVDVFSDNNIARCDYLKIDCEGSEYELLLNSPKEIFDKIDRIILEWHKVENHNMMSLVNLFYSVGYLVKMSKKHSTITAYRL